MHFGTEVMFVSV